MDDPRQYWVGFNLVKGIGSARLRLLLDHFGSIQAAWNAPLDRLYATGLSPRLVDNLIQVRSEVSLERVWERIQAQGVRVLTWEDEIYPRRLMEIDQPPPVLYVRGELSPQDDWSVAVVGTRRITAYGRQVTEKIAGFLANNGITVISGMARGVDAAAHRTALESGGRTLAVLGCGVDRIYPPEHRKLAETIIQNGALISDYPLGTSPDSMNFPARNRIISGLAQAVVVVEAGERSGALITARFAADQGRDVFAVPGNINAPQSVGANRLIQQGAHPLLEPQEILEILNLTMVIQHQSARVALPADATEAQLLRIISQEPVHVDDICNSACMPIEQVTAALAMMELKGMVRQVGGMHYIAVGEPPAAYEVSEGE
ncbi:MAG: DNA-processing protein DprA [Anaerolineales bacterium]